jgi:hypothetical protein
MKRERGWRKLLNEELHNLYFSTNIIRMIKFWKIWARHVARTGDMRNAYKILFGKPEGKTPLGRYRRRWDDNIKMEIGFVVLGWILMAQDRDR